MWARVWRKLKTKDKKVELATGETIEQTESQKMETEKSPGSGSLQIDLGGGNVEVDLAQHPLAEDEIDVVSVSRPASEIEEIDVVSVDVVPPASDWSDMEVDPDPPQTQGNVEVAVELENVSQETVDADDWGDSPVVKEEVTPVGTDNPDGAVVTPTSHAVIQKVDSIDDKDARLVLEKMHETPKPPKTSATSAWDPEPVDVDKVKAHDDKPQKTSAAVEDVDKEKVRDDKPQKTSAAPTVEVDIFANISDSPVNDGSLKLFQKMIAGDDEDEEGEEEVAVKPKGVQKKVKRGKKKAALGESTAQNTKSVHADVISSPASPSPVKIGFEVSHEIDKNIADPRLKVGNNSRYANENTSVFKPTLLRRLNYIDRKLRPQPPASGVDGTVRIRRDLDRPQAGGNPKDFQHQRELVYYGSLMQGAPQQDLSKFKIPKIVRPMAPAPASDDWDDGPAMQQQQSGNPFNIGETPSAGFYRQGPQQNRNNNNWGDQNSGFQDKERFPPPPQTPVRRSAPAPTMAVASSDGGFTATATPTPPKSGGGFGSTTTNDDDDDWGPKLSTTNAAGGNDWGVPRSSSPTNSTSSRNSYGSNDYDNNGSGRSRGWGVRGGGDRGSGRGGRGERNREGEWPCPSCSYATNFAWRSTCFRCQADKPGGAGGNGDSSGYGGGTNGDRRGGGRGRGGGGNSNYEPLAKRPRTGDDWNSGGQQSSNNKSFDDDWGAPAAAPKRQTSGGDDWGAPAPPPPPNRQSSGGDDWGAPAPPPKRQSSGGDDWGAPAPPPSRQSSGGDDWGAPAPAKNKSFDNRNNDNWGAPAPKNSFGGGGSSAPAADDDDW